MSTNKDQIVAILADGLYCQEAERVEKRFPHSDMCISAWADLEADLRAEYFKNAQDLYDRVMPLVSGSKEPREGSKSGDSSPKFKNVRFIHPGSVSDYHKLKLTDATYQLSNVNSHHTVTLNGTVKGSHVVRFASESMNEGVIIEAGVDPASVTSFFEAAERGTKYKLMLVPEESANEGE